MSTSTKLPSEERRTRTVETVVELAGEQNPSEISTTAIARRMGVTQGALFKHFPTKEAILKEVMEWVAERLLSQLDKAARDAPTALARLEAIFMAHIAFVAEHPGVPRMMFGELQRAGRSGPKQMVQTLVKRYRERLHKVMQEGKARGELSPTLDIDAASILFLGAVQGLVIQSLLDGDLARMRREARAVFATYCAGIGVAR